METVGSFKDIGKRTLAARNKIVQELKEKLFMNDVIFEHTFDYVIEHDGDDEIFYLKRNEIRVTPKLRNDRFDETSFEDIVPSHDETEIKMKACVLKAYWNHVIEKPVAGFIDCKIALPSSGRLVKVINNEGEESFARYSERIYSGTRILKQFHSLNGTFICNVEEGIIKYWKDADALGQMKAINDFMKSPENASRENQKQVEEDQHRKTCHFDGTCAGYFEGETPCVDCTYYY
jgi:hypothetical protein